VQTSRRDAEEQLFSHCNNVSREEGRGERAYGILLSILEI
tara:strand:+ start:954 stop:1073 length:120 start_codon:yes stop_codon:yes gene_type:complete